MDFSYEPPSWYKMQKRRAFPSKLSHAGTIFYITTSDYGIYDRNMFQPFSKFRTIIHNPDELPSQADHHFFSEDNRIEKVYLEVQSVRIDKTLESWTSEQRNCFRENEKRLKFFRIYTRRNCEHECLSDAVLATCGCVPFYMIRESSKQLDHRRL